MTRQEAIEILKPFRDDMNDQHGCQISDAVFALDIAIQCLEVMDKTIKELDQYAKDIKNINDDFLFGQKTGVFLALGTIENSLKKVEEN